MKIMSVNRLLDKGGFTGTQEWQEITKEISDAIAAVQWPPGSGSFLLYPELGKKRGQGNGVTPIKTACMGHLKAKGWKLEAKVPIAVVKQPGAIDAVRQTSKGLYALEWETGNISSSHRALNKIALGMLQSILIGGALIVPTRALYQYLTDRVGNLSELQPYFPLWSSLPVERGVLEIIAIEHDGLSREVPIIKKGTSGRALQ